MSELNEHGDPGTPGALGAPGAEGAGAGGTGGAGGAGGTGAPGAPGAQGPQGESVTGPRGKPGRAQPWQVIAAFALVVAVAFAVAGLAAWQVVALRGQTDDIAAQQRLICRVANENRESLRATFEDAARRTATSSQRTRAEKREAAVFYRDALARLPADPCKPKTVKGDS